MKQTIRDAAVRLGYAATARWLGFTEDSLISGLFHKVWVRDFLDDLDINCVLDVGANVGQYSRMLRRLGYRGHIISFEPSMEVYSVCAKSFEGDERWSGFPFALGSTNEERPFHIPRNSDLSSLLEPLFPVAEPKTIQVTVKRLDSIIDQLLDGFDNPRVFLKMDTQGFDLEVIKGAEGCLNRVLGMQSEVSVHRLYDEQPHYLTSLAAYEELGFKLANLLPVNRTDDGSILEFDCFMTRAPITENEVD